MVIKVSFRFLGLTLTYRAKNRKKKTQYQLLLVKASYIGRNVKSKELIGCFDEIFISKLIFMLCLSNRQCRGHYDFGLSVCLCVRACAYVPRRGHSDRLAIDFQLLQKELFIKLLFCCFGFVLLTVLASVVQCRQLLIRNVQDLSILYDHYLPTVTLIIIGIPSPTYSFTLGLNPSFSANPPYRSLSFFSFRFHYMDFPDCLLLLLSISVFLLFSFSVFTLFQLSVPCGRLS